MVDPHQSVPLQGKLAGRESQPVSISAGGTGTDDSQTWLNLAAYLECTEVEGPGRRFALWTQGCLIRCPGCCNPEMFSFTPRLLIPAAELLSRIGKAKEQFHLEGVTFLGGEPTHQAQGLAQVARGCQQMGLSVMLFTGYTLEELKSQNLPGVEPLLRHCDLVVDGPFLRHLPERERNWVGSTNQRIHFLSDRYQPGLEYDPRFRPAVELRVLDTGKVIYNGTPLGGKLHAARRK